jgi:eukaryotic-like serine/threonine-protein kinase
MRFRAFISYSHKDRPWAEWLHTALEGHRVDRDLVGRQTPVGPVPKTLRPIFRDREDFAGGPSLKDATLNALQQSDFLVVICSPNSQRSHYVNEEVRLFKQLGHAERVIPVIVAGEPDDPEHECFPPAVKFQIGAEGQITSIPAEPIAADAREAGDGREIAKQKVVAGLLGVSLDEIRKRAAHADRRRHLVLSSIAALMAALAVLAGVAAWIARQRTTEAEQRLEWALETAGAITTKAATFKDKFGVPVPILSELLGQVDQLLGRLDQQGVNSSSLKLREALLLQALSDNNKDLGDTTRALDEAARSVSRLEAIEKQDGKTPDTEYDIGLAYLKLGDLYKQRNAVELAKDNYTKAQQVFTSSSGSDPDTTRWQNSLAATSSRLSDILSAEGNLQGAASMLDEDVSISRRLYLNNPQNTFQASTLAIALVSRATLAQRENDNDKAIVLLTEAEQIDKKVAKIDPTNAQWAANLAFCEDKLGYAIERTGRIADAIPYYDAARETFEKLTTEDPTNVRKKDWFAHSLDTLGYDYQRTGRMIDAVKTFKKQVQVRREIIALDPADGGQKSTLTISLNRLAYALSSLGDTEAALSAAKESLTLTAQLINDDPKNVDLKTERVVSLGMVAIIENTRGNEPGATAAYEEMAQLGTEIAKLDPADSNKSYAAIAGNVFLANWYRQTGKAEKALSVLERARVNAESLHKGAPDDPSWLLGLSLIYEQINQAKWDLGDVQGALEAAKKCLELSKAWADRDSKNNDALQRLANAFTLVGNASRRLGKFDEAHAAHASAIEIRQKLSRSDPTNVAIQADLAVSWSRLGDLLLDQNDYGPALDAYQKGLATINKFADLDSSNQFLRDTIGQLYSGIGRSFQGLNRNMEARQAYQLSQAIWEELTKKQPQNATFRQNLEWSRQRLREVDTGGGVAAANPEEK